MRRLRALTARLPVWRPGWADVEGQSPDFLPLLAVGLGVFLVCSSYGLGREHRGGAAPAYWLGLLLVLAPIVLGVLDVRATRVQRTRLLLLLALVQSFLSWAYSPLRLTFPDELQHLRTAQDILRTGHLFTPNSFLPVSPGFPGLEIVTTTLVSVTGLDVRTCGLLVTTAAHVLLVAALLGLYESVLGSGRTASLAALVYAANPHGAYFNTKFIYVTLAMPFMVLALSLALRSGGPAGKALALVPVAAASVTHHVSALAAVALIIALGASSYVLLASAERRGRTEAATLVLLGLNGLVITIGWTTLASPETFNYLSRPAVSLVQSLVHSGDASAAVVRVAKPPMWETGVSALSVLLTTGLVAAGALLLRRRTAPPYARALTLMACCYPGVLLVRLFASNGAELAARSLTYVMLLVAVPAGVTLHWLTAGARRGTRFAGLAVSLVLFAGAVTIGLPPFWERIPGQFQIAGFEAGHDVHVEQAGRWAQAHLPRNLKSAGDLSLGAVLASYADADLSTEASPVFYQGTVRGVREQVSRLSLDVVFVDRRLTQQTPITGAYFAGDTLEGKHTSPLPERMLAPFDVDPLIDRVYDDGTVRGYLTGRVWRR